MPHMQGRLKARVKRRTAFRCEYCHFPERFGELRFQLDPIRAEQHGGPTVLANLAWSCLRCNKHKGPNLSGVDPKTNRTVRLFHPRLDLWEKHFAWQGHMLLGLTPMGRATVSVLECNHPDALLTREALMAEGVSFA